MLTDRQQKLAAICAAYQSMSIDAAEMEKQVLATCGILQSNVDDKGFKILEPVEQTTYVDQRPVTHVETAVPSQPKLLFLRTPKRLQQVEQDAIRRQIAAMDIGMQVVLLTDGMDLVNQQEFVPDSMKVRVGTMEIDSTGSIISGTRVVIDGKQCDLNIRSMTIKFIGGERPTVQMDIFPN